MVTPTPSWNTVRVHGTWLNFDGSMKAGTYKVTMPVRVTNATDDVIIPKGVFAAGALNTTPGLPSLDLQVLAGDDPDNAPSGFQPSIAVTFNDGSELYVLDVPVALSGDSNGINLRQQVLPETLPAPTPVLIRGVAGGLAELDVDGDVVNAAGVKVGGSAATPSTGAFVLSKPGPLAVAGGAARLPIPFTCTLLGVRAAIGGLANAPVTVDVNRNGTTVFTNANNRPSIPAGQHDAQDPFAVSAPLVPGDYLTVDVDATGGQTAPTFVARTTAGGSFGQTVTVTRPAGAAVGDVHIAFVWLNTGDAVGATSPAQTSLTAVPAGWTLIGTGPTRNAYNAADRYLEQWMYWWRDDGTQPSWSWTAATPVSSSSFAAAEVLTYRGLKPTGNPIDVFATASPAASSTSWAAPSVTPTNATDLLVTNWMGPAAITNPVFPNGSTGHTGGSPPIAGFVASDRVLSSTDPTGTQTLSGTTSPTSRMVATTLGLLPDPAATIPGSDLTVVVEYEVTG